MSWCSRPPPGTGSVVCAIEEARRWLLVPCRPRRCSKHVIVNGTLFLGGWPCFFGPAPISGSEATDVYERSSRVRVGGARPMLARPRAQRSARDWSRPTGAGQDSVRPAHASARSRAWWRRRPSGSDSSEGHRRLGCCDSQHPRVPRAPTGGSRAWSQRAPRRAEPRSRISRDESQLVRQRDMCYGPWAVRRCSVCWRWER